MLKLAVRCMSMKKKGKSVATLDDVVDGLKQIAQSLGGNQRSLSYSNESEATEAVRLHYGVKKDRVETQRVLRGPNK